MFSARFSWTTEINRLTKILAQKKTAGETLLDLTVSNPTQTGLAYPEADILKALSLKASLVYEPDPRGLTAARKAVQRYYSDHGRSIRPDDVVITSGTGEAYSFLFKLLCDSGNDILVPQPGYPLLDFLASLEFLTVVPYVSRYTPEKGWAVDIRSIRESIRESTAAVVVISPNNPTGSYIKQEELDEIGAICADRHLALIVDEVFSDYPGKPPDAVAGSAVNSAKALTFVLNGLSKICCLPQVKMGWICVSGPRKLASDALERLEWIADTYLSVSGMVQHAAPALLENRHLIQDQVKKRIRSNEAFLMQALKPMPHVRPLIREGGWYSVIEIRNGLTDDQMACQWLIEGNVSVHPGYFYGFDQDGLLVLSLMTPPDIFQEGVLRIAKMI